MKCVADTFYYVEQSGLILTPAPTHEGLIRQALQAGKHVYTEKTMTLSTESAGELIALAKEKGLYLGAAPDTFLGAALQTARKAIDDGLIGEITSFEACANRDLDLLAGMFSFLRMEGGGICYDFGVYYLTALVSLFGPVDSLVASVHFWLKTQAEPFHALFWKCPQSYFANPIQV